MTDPAARTPAVGGRRRQVALGVLRSIASAVVLVALYYLLPLDQLASVPLTVILVVALLLAAVAAWQLRLILGSKYPGVRAAEALATTAPLFLLLFASAYFAMARATPAAFGQHLTRTDALYFTVTTFSTVGYGDITAVSQAARLLVTAQIILDLLVLGLVIKLFIGAARVARQARAGTGDPATTPSPQPPG